MREVFEDSSIEDHYLLLKCLMLGCAPEFEDLHREVGLERMSKREFDAAAELLAGVEMGEEGSVWHPVWLALQVCPTRTAAFTSCQEGWWCVVVVTSASLSFLISVLSPQSPWPLGLRSDLLLKCDLRCCLGFLQGLLFEFRRKEKSCNEDHQEAEQCCDQIHR